MNVVVLDYAALNYPEPSGFAPIREHMREHMAEFGRLMVFERSSGLEVLDRARSADILLTCRAPIGRDLMDIFTRLRYIGVLGSDFAHVDTNYARMLNLPVSCVPASALASEPVSESGARENDIQYCMRIAALNIRAWLRGEVLNRV